MLRFAIAMTLVSGYAAAQNAVPASQWKDVAKEIAGEAALIRVAARDVATKETGMAVDIGALRENIDAQQARAAHIQTKLYEVERSEVAAGLYRDDRLDKLKEKADRLSDLTAVQRASLHFPEGKPEWGVLRRQAKSTDRIAQEIERDIERFAN